MMKLMRMRWSGHIARTGEMMHIAFWWESEKERDNYKDPDVDGTIIKEKRNAYRILVGKPECKRPLGRPRRRWVDNIKMDLREIGWD
jgi:hypothetical protein